MRAIAAYERTLISFDSPFDRFIDPDLKKKIATRGSYTRAMLPAEAIAFVQAEQRKWKPVLELIANKTN